MYPKQLSSKDIKDGGTPLHWAKSREVIEMLLEVNTNINAKNFKGMLFTVFYIKNITQFTKILVSCVSIQNS